MDLTGEERIAAPRQAVWDALNDIETLKDCIPGCEDIERLSPTEIRAALKVNLGIVKVRFHGMLELSNMNPPASYTISGHGEGSIAGFAHGVTDVMLTEVHRQTNQDFIAILSSIRERRGVAEAVTILNTVCLDRALPKRPVLLCATNAVADNYNARGLAALEGASNRLINVEELTEDEVRTLHQHYRKLVEIAQREGNLTRSHSIEEAEVRHRVKKRREQQWAELSGVSGARPPDSKPSGRSGGAR